jgi:hypothetical protein
MADEATSSRLPVRLPELGRHNVSNFPRKISETSGSNDKAAELFCASPYGF